jgi:glycosyltransferase involved in cell wall biosynthesis
MITYNQDNYISQAIDSVLMQVVNFNYIIIICDDHSSDNTSQICRNYKKKFPDKISLIVNQQNIGAILNFIQALDLCKGKYIALLEGDDYWTDPLKLQKQVDFMEANPQYSITSHRFKILDEENKTLFPDFASELFGENIEGISFDQKSFLDLQLTQTMTVILKREYCDLDLFAKLESGDLALFYCCLLGGMGYCLNFEGAVYRRHLRGLYSKKEAYDQIRRRFYFHRSMYKITSDSVFKKHYDSHFDILLGQIKKHIGKIDLPVREDIFSVLEDDLYWRNYLLFLNHSKKLITWKLKSLFK